MAISIQDIVVVAILLCFFLGRFLFTAIKGKRKLVKTAKEIISGRFLISFFVYFAFPLLIIFDVLEYAISAALLWPLFAIGLIFSVIGLVLMLQSRLYRQSDWGFMGDDGGEVLFIRGPYKITRHPYYVGAILIGIGVYLILNSWLVVLIIPTIMFITKVIEAEDKYLKEKFGVKWEEYRKKTGIIPWIKP